MITCQPLESWELEVSCSGSPGISNPQYPQSPKWKQYSLTPKMELFKLSSIRNEDKTPQGAYQVVNAIT